MLASNPLQRLRLYFLVGLVWSALQASAVASEQRSPDNLDAWRIDDVSEIALRYPRPTLGPRLSLSDLQSSAPWKIQ
jgi:hypothetical protein